MLFTADIVVNPHVIALRVQKPGLPISGVILGIVNGDDDLELVWIDLANTFHRTYLISVRRAGGVDKSLVIETGRFDYQRIAFEVTHGVPVVERKREQLFFPRHRLVHSDRAYLMIEFVNHRDLAGRAINDFERIRRCQHARQSVRHAIPAGRVNDGAVF